MTTGKIIALTGWTCVGKVMSLLFNMLSRFVIAFLPRSTHLLISRLYIVTCLFILYVEYIMKNTGLMKLKLESRLSGEISITSYMQVTPPLWQKVKKY